MDLQFGEFDCEDHRDFAQYYKYRYFGLKEGQVIIPAAYGEISRTDLSLFSLPPGSEQVQSTAMRMSYFKEIGVFGHPILGNVNIGPTFAYLTIPPKRESIKGISVAACTFRFPKHAGLNPEKVPDIFEQWLRKTSNQGLYNALRDGGYGNTYRSIDEFKIIESIYNRKYIPLERALRGLALGEYIGRAISHKLGVFYTGDKEEVQLFYRGEHVGGLEKDRYERQVPCLKREYAFLERIIFDEMERGQEEV